MAIATVVTRGYGNGTYSGTIALVVTHGYAISEVVPDTVILKTYDTIGGRQGGRAIKGIQGALAVTGSQGARAIKGIV